jgi:hypothetical protein
MFQHTRKKDRVHDHDKTLPNIGDTCKRVDHIQQGLSGRPLQVGNRITANTVDPADVTASYEKAVMPEGFRSIPPSGLR